MAILKNLQFLKADKRFYSAPEFIQFDGKMTTRPFAEMFEYDALTYKGLWQIVRSVERKGTNYVAILKLCILKTK